MLVDYLFFFLKAFTIIGMIFALFALAVAALSKAREEAEAGAEGSVEISSLSEEFDDLRDLIESETLSEKEYKKLKKRRKKEEKREEKHSAAPEGDVYHLTFKGDIEANEVAGLRECVTALLLSAKPEDEIVVTIDSPGGYVHSYGLAASQLQRIRARQLKLTVVIDAVAASGGYLMAVVGQKIVAAPFAVVGSIGVIAELPNFNRLLKKYDIDYEQHTAGEYKSTLSVFAQNTAKGREKFQEELEDTHRLFKDFITEYRPHLPIDQIATGEHWHASQAKGLGLVDEIMTSDDYLLKLHRAGHKVYQVKYAEHHRLSERLMNLMEARAYRLIRRVFAPSARHP